MRAIIVLMLVAVVGLFATGCGSGNDADARKRLDDVEKRLQKIESGEIWKTWEQGITLDAKGARCADEIRQMAGAVRQYRVKYDSYPKTFENLSELKGVRVPATDPWGRPYVYALEGASFVIRSQGEKVGDAADDIYWDGENAKVVQPKP